MPSRGRADTISFVKPLCSLLGMLFFYSVFAQQDVPTPSKTSIAYREYREAYTKPPYGLAKVEGLIKKYKLRDDTSDNPSKLPANVFAKLSLKEQFTYHMIYGESFSQNCDAMPVLAEEEKHIYAYPPGAFQDERSWSEGQHNEMKKHRKVFVPLIKETILSKGRIGCNLKAAILDLEAVELIPSIIEVYKRQRKDHDILSVLMILMKEGKYKPFLESQSFKKLYDESASYQSFLIANKANQDLVMERATAFYKLKMKK